MKNIIKKIFIFILIIIIISVSIIFYSHYIGTKGLIIKEFKITNDKLPDNFHGLKIVHFSDIYYGSTVKEKEISNLVKKINELKPDIIVFTGDLLNNNINLKEKDLNLVTKYLSNLKASIGKYAISGNEDYNNKDYETILTNSNFVNLNDTFEFIYNKDYTPILISGLSSNLKNKKNIKEKLALTNNEINKYEMTNPNGLYSILIMHEPDFIDNIDIQKFDLILAGHSLGGNINIPIIKNFLLNDGSKKYYENHYKINNTDFFINNGIGTDDFNYRLLNKPSVNFYRLTKY